MLPTVAAGLLALSFVSVGLGLYTLNTSDVSARLALDDSEPSTQQPPGTRYLGRVTALLLRAGARVAPRVVSGLAPQLRAKLDHRISAAGRPNGWALEQYVAIGVGAVLCSGLIALVLAIAGNRFGAVLVLASGLILPGVWLSRKRRLRQEAIDTALPDFLDVLAVTVSAGMSVRGAIARVADTLDDPLADELATTIRQMEFGVSSRDALEALSDRNDSPALGRLVTGLVQAEELGAPLAESLHALAEDMRRTFHQTARRRAARAAPRISLITVMVILPGALILILAGLVLGSGVNFGGIFG